MYISAFFCTKVAVNGNKNRLIKAFYMYSLLSNI